MQIEEQVQGIALTLETNEEVFSPGAVDRGTKAMLSFVTFAPGDKVLDLGCGCGVVGILAAKQLGAEDPFVKDAADDKDIERWLAVFAANGLEVRVSK